MEKYSIKIYDTNLKELARLENAFNIGYELKLNELWTCKFDLPTIDKKNKYCQPFNYVELFDNGSRIDLFRILPTVHTVTDKEYITYQCEHVLATLIDDVLFKYHQIGNIGIYTDRVIRYVLDRQSTKRWQLTECDFKRQFEYKWENENLLAALLSIPKPFDVKYSWKWDTTRYPWSIALKKLDPAYKVDISYKKNMRNIEKTVDPTNLVTRLYALGYGEGDNQLDIKSVNNGVPYLEKNVGKYGLKQSILVDRRFESPETLKEYTRAVLNDLSEPYISYKVSAVDLAVKDGKKYKKFYPGDYILIKDIEDKTNLTFPIVRVSKSDIKSNPFDVELEIANKSQDITGSISDIMERARINDTYAQGATNLMQMAFVDNADNRYPAKFKFYLPQEMARINKLILTYTVENFRAYSKATKGGGAQTKTTSSGGGDYTSTEWSGSSYATTGVDNYSGWGLGTGGHNHGIPHNTLFADTSGRQYYWVESGNHTHTVEIQGHSHSVNIPSHYHSFTLPDHTHDIEYGIYENSAQSWCYLIVDGKTVYNYNSEVNLIPYLSKDDGGRIQRGTWHEIRIVPDKLVRINASLFIQLFTTSRGGGDF